MDNRFSGRGRMLGHGLLMMLCCLLPILVIGLLPLTNLKSTGLGFLVFLLCPLMHIAMIFMMTGFSGKKPCHGTTGEDAQVEDKE